ncbi:MULTISPECIES: DUF1572 family protein [Bizionia]|uniref:DUF1572 domain-containing protein n=1 Tax=Bizionia algoritergicola TaxID=291187 RepID=A0A5D0QVM2_9FLAO|nr:MULTISPECIES: DUF1572 family protein [Bizionia]OBX21111.1 hypothetical protein BAA08_14085 [Bizionia sp. APA-3]TYB72244.1 DUF1572 domain-containing protein [Bizionia algoritergicola]
MENELITSIIKQFNYYKAVGDKTFDQLTFEEMTWQYNDSANSISIIVKHMVGNMFSRWTNFLTEDGEKTWRQRDQEFEASYTNKDELISAWERGWKCLFDAIEPLKNNELNTIIYIRNEEHLVSEAIFRQLGHYSYHIGQIAHIGKMLKGNDWQPLSIAKGNSAAYNKVKFSKEKENK